MASLMDLVTDLGVKLIETSSAALDLRKLSRQISLKVLDLPLVVLSEYSFEVDLIALQILLLEIYF